MNYTELLNSPEWKAKRQEVLKRDNYECQRCGYNKSQNKMYYIIANIKEEVKLEIVSKDVFGAMKICKFYDHEEKTYVYCKVNKNASLEYATDEGTFIIHLRYKKNINKPFNGSTISTSKSSFFEKNANVNHTIDDMVNKELKDNKVFSTFSVDKESYYFTHINNINEYIKYDNLHVHHRCYRETKQIWDQIDEEYVTLCNICHKIVHESQLIPFYNRKGEIFQYMKPCWKCLGQRYFECYRHVENGICFACNGLGYEPCLQTLKKNSG